MINAGFANNCGIELFTIGWVQCPGADPLPPYDPGPPSQGGGRRSERPSYRDGPHDALEQTRRKRILQEDDDIVALITAMLGQGLM